MARVKGDLRLQELAKAGETLSRQKQMEEEFYARRVAIGFESTEERITAEETFRSKVFDINKAIFTNTKAFGAASTLNEAEQALAREEAVKRSAQRNTEHWKSNFDIIEALRRQDLDDLETYYRGDLDMANARFAGDQEIARKERELLREQLAFKLRLTQEEVDRLLFLRKSARLPFDAGSEGAQDILDRADPTLSAKAREGILESGAAKDILLAERANDDFFAGWSRGLQKYSQDRDSAFGMSADMARRTAQGMEQGFQNFFFGVMEGKFKSFKDVLSGVLEFTKQIIAQMTAQLATIAIIDGISDAFSGGIGTPSSGSSIIGSIFKKGSNGGEVVHRFAFGGPVPGVGSSDTVPALLTPGEFVLSRSDVRQIRSGAAGGNSIVNNITVYAGTGRNESSSTGAQPNFQQLARDLSKLVETKLIEEQRPGGLLAGR